MAPRRPLLALTLLAGCAHGPPADLVLTRCAVHPMDGGGVAEAVAVRDGRIALVGSAREARALIGQDTEVIDCEDDGRAVLPGLIDAHTHLVWSATELEDVDLYDATTLDELLTPITEWAAAWPDAPWVRGGGWDLSVFDGQLHKGQLDAIVPDRPVYMSSADAHSAWVNSLALAEAGITADTPDPEGGRIERDEAGEPTGILRENAIALVEDLLPAYPEAQVDTGLSWALVEANASGLTTIVDANVEDWMLAGYRRFEDEGRLSVRVFGAVEVDPEEGAAGVDRVQAMADTWGSPLVSVNAIKLYLDGGIETQTAYMLQPYTDGSNGDKLYPDDVLRETIRAFDAAGFRLHAHAIGDGAVRQMLDALQWLEQTSGPADRRPLLAHLEVIDPQDIPRFAELGAVADFQPLWAYPDSYIQDLTWPVIGAERSQWLYPIGAVAEAGGDMAFGSDWSVSSMNPFEACEVAVGRMDPWDGGEVLTPQHRIGIEACLMAYTAGGARAVHREEELGTLTVGKRADLVLLDEDPFTVETAALSDVRPQRIWLDGRLVYDSDVSDRPGRGKGLR